MTTTLPMLPGGRFVDASRQIAFTFEGKIIQALAGQSIAAALYAAGMRTFSRSFKYHRPRGLFCVSGDCPNCLMQVDGKPNVRTCIEPAKEGQVVAHQNAWPSLNFDVLRTFDKFDRFLPVGFYYKRFHKPRWMWPIFERMVRRIAGVGRIDVNGEPPLDGEIEHLHTEVCVVGGGPAGLAAADSAARCGARVVLVEQLPILGGHLLYSGDQLSQVEPLIQSLRENPRTQVRCGTTAFGLYEGNELAAFQGNRLLKIRARQIIISTGGREQPFVFHNNDLPGIFLGRGVQRLGRLYGVAAGKRAVVVTDRDDGIGMARELAALGIEVAATVDCRPGAPHPQAILQANGSACLSSVTVADLKDDGSLAEATMNEIPCDLLCVASSLRPANELLLQGGVGFQYQEGRWQISQSVPGILAAGAVAGTMDLSAQLLEGRLRGGEAAAALGYVSLTRSSDHEAWEACASKHSPCHGCLMPQIKPKAGKRFICLCEDVTEKDLHMAVAEGFDGIETLKRYSTVNMGPCQGKVCGHAVIEVCSRATGQPIATVGMTTSRPPVVPVPMKVLAAGSTHPIRRTPMHHWHQAAGASWLDAGQWKRPDNYGDPAGEVRTIRNGVGLIDVSTLGKIEVIGPDAAELLERVYVNKWADLKLGRTRYGVMCTEEGIVFDDGVGGRLSENRFYITASTGNTEAVVQWLEMWQSIWRLNVTILNRSGALAAMNLAGPKSREVLKKLTGLDLSNESFPYLGLREGEVAGVPCRLMRVGFVGELGYEIHCPSAYGLFIWESLCEAGKEFGLKPCGIEAQRILRLEKGHLIVTVDTDALSNPLEAGLEWAVRFEKPMFHGREPLLRLKAMGARSKLVGFTMQDRNLVPSEGCQVVENGRPVGRVTSSRYSPTLGRSIGLAWVPAKVGKGQRFLIRFNEKDVPAVATPIPFYDPEGKRMKS